MRQGYQEQNKWESMRVLNNDTATTRIYKRALQDAVTILQKQRNTEISRMLALSTLSESYECPICSDEDVRTV